MSRFGLSPFTPGWYDDVGRSHSLFDQFFGQSLFDEDLMLPSRNRQRLHHHYHPALMYNLRLPSMSSNGEVGPMRPTFDRQRSGVSKISNDRNEFKVCLDVQQFKPEEVTVKTVDNFVVIEGKHEEKEDEHGFIQRHFIRKYLLPEDVKPETVKCTLSSDGVLAISAPKQTAVKESNERVVPITQSPYPALSSNKPAAGNGGAKEEEKQTADGENQDTKKE